MPTIDFKGKQHIYAHHLTVPYRPLVPDADRSVDPTGADDNLIIHGDNLEALKALLPRYAERVKCIYIDPPYNTGHEGWIYNDRVNSALMRAWLEANGPVDGEDLERHDKWLCMMWPRLHLLKELLAQDGVIFVSIDDHEQHHLRMMMDEIFGADNFFCSIVRRAMHTVRNTSKDFNLNADYILAYAKEKSWFAQDKSRYIRHIKDKSGSYTRDDGDDRGKYKLDPLHARNYYDPYVFEFSNGVVWSAPEGRYPAFSPESLRKMEQDNRIDFSGKSPMAKRHLSDVQKGQPPDALLSSEIVGFNSTGTREIQDIFGKSGVFSQPKPARLIKFLIEILRSPDAIVLDSFAGSGTTAHAVLALNREDGGNRKFILIECEDYAGDVTAQRVQRVIRGVPGAKDAALREGLGGSFCYCTLGEPLDAETMLTGETLPDWSAIAAWLLHTATGISAGPTELAPQNADGLFYATETTDFYLLYEPDMDWLRSNRAILNEDRVKRIDAVNQERGRKAIVFGPGKYIGQRDLTRMGVTFCQLPYELHRVAQG